MSLLLDIFGFLSVLLSGFGRSAQCIYVGSLAFLFLAARPLCNSANAADAAVIDMTRRIAFFAAAFMFAVLAANLWAHTAILAGTTDGSYLNALGGTYATAQLLRLGAALVAVLLLARRGGASDLPLPFLALADIFAGIATSHAAARLDNQNILIVATALHHLGAAIWIGGLPAFLYAVGKLPAGPVLERIGLRFSHLSALSVLAIAASGIVMLVYYVGSPEAMYGTAYGMMLGTKSILFLTLLGLGAFNAFAVRQLASGRAAPLLRLKRFVEVEIGIGLTVLFVAASITSLPPAIDLTEGRATLSDIVGRLEPKWPSLSSPDKSTLAYYEEQRQASDGMGQDMLSHMQVYVPGSGVPLPRNAEDIAWSEYNHHWAGIFVLLIGVLALLERGGRAPWAKHWPLLFIGLAGFLFVRSEAEGWPFGSLGLIESMRDPEFVQHKLFMVLITGFAGFEWSVRTGVLTRNWARYVFPLLSAVGGMMLLTHSHSIANVKELLLIEMTHMPIAVLGIWAAWARWLELRLDGRGRAICGWLWPTFFCLVGIVLILYREI
ncbi:copper resistance D family protein [Dongia rigui]|uniref:CopD family protein n=1 Tax=Dongia rigui TaxID=940149 RepID=A0ABU5E1L3_9PROT|nr:CopD family protein [Dongia rigui]MDY0873373.1 CopD family protein [Dongia rigui]